MMVIDVEGVKCEGCASNIEKGLMALAGVERVVVLVASGRVEISGTDLDRDTLAKTLAALGYAPRS